MPIKGLLSQNNTKEFIGNEELFLQLLADLDYAVGDIIYWSGKQFVKLPIGAEGQTLKVVNGLPEWV